LKQSLIRARKANLLQGMHYKRDKELLSPKILALNSIKTPPGMYKIWSHTGFKSFKEGKWWRTT
jgi:hypothetical protein